MIAKISSSNTLYSALAYNQMKVDDHHAKVIFTNKMIEPKSGIYDISTCLRSFEPYLLANKRTEKPVLHISLNPDPKDKLSDEQLSEIAETYMQKMGYGDQPFIVYKHEDIEREHIHIVSLRVNEQGRKICDKFEHRRSMDACREIEQQFNLKPATKEQQSLKSPLSLKAVNHKKGDLKQQITNVIRPVSKSYHFQSLKEYRALLTLYNIGVEEVKSPLNPPKGDFKGLIYFALNEKGEKKSAPFNASLFGKSVGINALEKRIEKSAEVIKAKKLKEQSKRVISNAMQQSKSRKEFEKILEKQGISVLFRENEQGRIYGATFIDHEQKYVFNGSRLGKEFSANSLNRDFNKISEIEKITDSKSWQFFNLENHGSDFFNNPENDDFEEQVFNNQHKKRKKKQRKI